MAIDTSFFDSPAQSAFDDDQTMGQRLGKIMSPTPAEELVTGPPPDRAPAHQVATSTPLTGNLARGPQQAVAKNQDNPSSYSGVSNPPDNGNVRSTVSPTQQAPLMQRQPLQARPNLMTPDRSALVSPGSTTPVVSPALPTQAPPSQLNLAQNRLNTLTSAPGISGIKNGFVRGAARFGDVLAQELPGIGTAIPGTTPNRNLLIQRQTGVVNNLQAQQQAGAQLEDTTQQAAQRAAKAQQDLADASRDALRNPTAKEADLYNLDPDAQYRPTELGKLAIEANKSAKPDSVNGMYASAVQDAMQRGVDPGQDPKVQQLADSITSIQKPAATKAEQRDDRAISILSKPPAERTPGENAYMTGYNQWVQETKVAPGTSRMQVLLQQPIAVADPNKPGSEKFVTKKDAIGMGAPGGVDTQVPKALAKDFTSGPDARTLTAFNTASAHLKLLNSAAKALNNGDIQGLNSISQEWAKQTGEPAPTNFAMVKTALAGELARTFTGKSATVDEINAINKSINNAGSPRQLAGVINDANKLMVSKRNVLKTQYEQGMKGQPNFGDNTPAPSGKAVSLAAARGLPQNKGKSDADITKDIQAHGHQVTP